MAVAGGSCGDDGAGLTEYAALVVVAAVLLGALVTSGLFGKVTGGVKHATCRLFGTTPCAHPTPVRAQEHGRAANHNPAPAVSGSGYGTPVKPSYRPPNRAPYAPSSTPNPFVRRPTGPWENRVDQALAELRRAEPYVKDGQVYPPAMTDMKKAFHGLTGKQIDAVFARLHTSEVQKLFGTHAGTPFGFDVHAQRKALVNKIMRNASMNTVEYLAKYSPDVNPEPTGHSATYQPYPGELYANGDVPAVGDVDQGDLADCFLVASMGEIALQHPNMIKHDIHANPNGTYTVTLHNPDGTVAHQTVTPDFPTRYAGSPYYAHLPDADQDGTGEIWAAILEKAVAKNRGGYDKLNHGGNAWRAMYTLTGHWGKSNSPGSLSLDKISEMLADGDAVVAGTPKTSKSEKLDGWHNYMVVRANRAAGTVTMRNPWGLVDNRTNKNIPKKDRKLWLPLVTLPYAQFVKDFSYVDTDTFK